MLNFISFLLDAGDTPEPDNSQLWVTLGLIAVMAVAFYFFVMRPQKKQREQASERMKSLKVGYKVRTIGGIYGEIVEINDNINTVTLKTGTDEIPSYIKFDKQAIYQIDTPKADGNVVDIEKSVDEVVQVPTGNTVKKGNNVYEEVEDKPNK